jgi:hypothetical protein
MPTKVLGIFKEDIVYIILTSQGKDQQKVLKCKVLKGDQTSEAQLHPTDFLVLKALEDAPKHHIVAGQVLNNIQRSVVTLAQ